MGNILQQDAVTGKQQQNNQENNHKIISNWQVLQKKQQIEILKSKRTALIVQRYWFEMQNNQDFQQQNKLFQWRNNNPNHEFMVNVLSVNKDQSLEANKSFQCSSMGLCPSQKISTKVYAVTERLLKLSQINDLINFQVEIENRKVKSRLNFSQASNQNCDKKIRKKFQKITPFMNMRVNELQAQQILKDWIRGIEVLCYKFGYFLINYDLLGITPHKRGNVWISSNYSINHLDSRSKFEVTTAQHKFRYQRQTIQKLILFTESIPWFRNIIYQLKQRRIQRFDDFCLNIDKRCIQEKPTPQTSRTIQNLYKNNHNTSLFVEHASFTDPNFYTNASFNSNSNFFMFDHRKALHRANSNEKILDDSLPGHRKNQLINSGKNILEFNQNQQIKRSNTGQKLLYKVSPQSKQHIIFVNSNHKNCGRETAPTNELGHSSSLQSVHNQIPHIRPQQYLMKHQGKSLYKTQNNYKINSLVENGTTNEKPSLNSNNKVYFHHNHNHSILSEPYLFRSQNYGYNDFNNPKNKDEKTTRMIHNYSLDEQNIIGPYRTERIYSNMRKEKIALVDSMVMVHQQSEQIQEDLHNHSGTKIIMQESIIIMGRNEPSYPSPRETSQKYFNQN